MFGDPSRIDLRLDSRSVSFENPTGERGAGGTVAGGRKGAPSQLVKAGDHVTLCDLEGPGTIRHIWCTVPPMPPERLRAIALDVYYDGRAEPSISVPLPDFFGCACGRPTAFASALTAVQEGRGFNAHFPMPFRGGVRIVLRNESAHAVMLYFQIDYTRQSELPPDCGILHAEFHRENPTALRRDFTITEAWRGPGRFLGCVVSIRPIDAGRWYGEGEVKVYRDGDATHPTICGTGLEDYVGSAWGMGAHHAPYAGAPLIVTEPGGNHGALSSIPDFVGFYRWHVPDPIVFHDELRVTIQQIGMNLFGPDDDASRLAYLETNPLAGNGWLVEGGGGRPWVALFERVDDYSAAAFVYCRDVQPVTPLDTTAAAVDMARRPYETADPAEAFLSPNS